jgi:hypothetical protein
MTKKDYIIKLLEYRKEKQFNSAAVVGIDKYEPKLYIRNRTRDKIAFS